MKNLPGDNYTFRFVFDRRRKRARVADQLERIGITRADAHQAIHESNDLTDDGKARRRRDVDATIAAALDELEATDIAALRRRVQMDEGMMDAPQRLRLPDGVSRAAAEAQAPEIRQLALSKPLSERAEFYYGCCDRDDVVAVMALESGSPSLELLGPSDHRDEVLAEGRERHAAAYAPGAYEELQELRSVLADNLHDLNRYRHEIGVYKWDDAENQIETGARP